MTKDTIIKKIENLEVEAKKEISNFLNLDKNIQKHLEIVARGHRVDILICRYSLYRIFKTLTNELEYSTSVYSTIIDKKSTDLRKSI